MDRLSADPTSRTGLDALGWTSALEDSFTPYADAGYVPGRVARVDRGRCDVLVAGTGTSTGTVAARTVRVDWSAIFDPDPVRNPCTGDWAAVDLGADPLPALHAVLDRRTAMVRGATGTNSHGQVLAANVDNVLITVSLAAKPDSGRIERLLALAWESGALPIVVLTKADAGYDPVRVAEVEALAPGATVLAVSALTGEGVDVLKAALAGGTAALIGQSGVGKSTLTNALAGADVMATGAARDVDEKGRHTTTTRELIPLPDGGVLIDTPGLRGVALFGGEEGLAQAFSDIEELADACRFADCAHVGDPGRAVLGAIADGRLAERRLESYRKLQRENAWIAARSDARLAADRQKEWKRRSRESNPARP